MSCNIIYAGNPGRQYSSKTNSPLSLTASDASITTQYTTSNATNGIIHQKDTDDPLESLNHTEFPVPTSTITSATIPSITPNSPGIFPTILHSLPTIPNSSSITTKNSAQHQEATSNYLENSDHAGFPLPAYTEISGSHPIVDSPPNPPPYPGIFATIPHFLPTIPNSSSMTTKNSAHHQEDTTNYLENSDHPGFPLPAYTENTENNPPAPEIISTISNLPSTHPSPIRTTQNLSPDQGNTIYPSENPVHPEFPIPEYTGPTGTTLGDDGSPKLPLHAMGYPGHTATTTDADPEWTLGSLIGGGKAHLHHLI